MESVMLTIEELDLQARDYLLSKGFKLDQEVEVTSFVDEYGQVISMVLPV